MQSVEAYLSVFDLRIIVRINAKCGITMSKETASNFFAECESGGGGTLVKSTVPPMQRFRVRPWLLKASTPSQTTVIGCVGSILLYPTQATKLSLSQ